MSFVGTRMTNLLGMEPESQWIFLDRRSLLAADIRHEKDIWFPRWVEMASNHVVGEDLGNRDKFDVFINWFLFVLCQLFLFSFCPCSSK